jgi:hypothetical protein
MTVYSYVSSKDELLDLVIDQVSAGIALPPAEGGWRERARALAYGLRAALLAHPQGARLISERLVQSPNALRVFDAGLGIFRSAGFPDELAADAYFAFSSYVMGSLFEDISGIGRTGRPRAGIPPEVPAPANVEQIPEDRFPNIRALAGHIYGSIDPGVQTTRSLRAAASSRRFDLGLNGLLDGLAMKLDR